MFGRPEGDTPIALNRILHKPWCGQGLPFQAFQIHQMGRRRHHARFPALLPERPIDLSQPLRARTETPSNHDSVLRGASRLGEWVDVYPGFGGGGRTFPIPGHPATSPKLNRLGSLNPSSRWTVRTCAGIDAFCFTRVIFTAPRSLGKITGLTRYANAVLCLLHRNKPMISHD